MTNCRAAQSQSKCSYKQWQQYIEDTFMGHSPNYSKALILCFKTVSKRRDPIDSGLRLSKTIIAQSRSIFCLLRMKQDEPGVIIFDKQENCRKVKRPKTNLKRKKWIGQPDSSQRQWEWNIYNSITDISRKGSSLIEIIAGNLRTSGGLPHIRQKPGLQFHRST